MDHKEFKKHLVIVLTADVVIIAFSTLLKFMTERNLEDAFYWFFEQKLPVWLIILSLSLLYLFYRLFIVKHSSISKFTLEENIFFDSDFSGYFDYEFRKEQRWNDALGRLIGQKAEAKVEFEKQIINHYCPTKL